MIIKKNEKGFALVVTMLFAMVGVAMSGAILYLTLQSTKIAGIGQRYATALEAGKAASDIVISFLTTYDSSAGTVPDYYDSSEYDSSCIDDKLTSATRDTAGGNYLWANCSGTEAEQTSLDPETKTDITFELGDYTAFTKIVDTKHTSDTSYDYYYYTIEILTYNSTNAKEKAQISLVYRLDIPT